MADAPSTDRAHAAPATLLALVGAIATLPAVMASDAPGSWRNPWNGWLAYVTLCSFPTGVVVALATRRLLTWSRNKAIAILWLFPLAYISLIISLFVLAARWQPNH